MTGGMFSPTRSVHRGFAASIDLQKYPTGRRLPSSGGSLARVKQKYVVCLAMEGRENV